MNFVRKVVRDAAVGVGVAKDPASLHVFSQPGCAALLWDREMPADIQAWLDQRDPDGLPNGRTVVATEAVADAVRQLLGTVPMSSERSWLEDDIIALAAAFEAILPAPYMRVRLDVVTGNACRKFHIDAIRARLICTYRGTGTQYGISTNGEEPENVFTVPTGAPFLLRGTLWPESPPSGLLHRSPPIEGSGETRLVLVLDPVFELEEGR